MSDTRNFRQVKAAPDEEMRPIAVIAKSPDELAATQAIRFRKDHDDLDSLRYALLELGSGRVVGLLRHDRNPDLGTELHAPVSVRRTAPVVREALSALGLSEGDLSWTLSKKRAGSKKREPVAA